MMREGRTLYGVRMGCQPGRRCWVKAESLGLLDRLAEEDLSMVGRLEVDMGDLGGKVACSFWGWDSSLVVVAGREES